MNTAHAIKSLSRVSALAGIVIAGLAQAEDKFVAIQGAQCANPPALHCPDTGCSGPTIINQGPVVEMKSRRTFFLDYPCDLKPGEKVMFVLSLHGGGSYGNWQRNYFPIMDYVSKYRLVIATPNSPVRVWSEVDDEYLHNIVEFVVGQVGKESIKSFWLAGHSQGGMTSNRLLRTDFFKSRVDGWLSLSGGRLGGQPVGGGFGRPPVSTTTPTTPSTSAAASAPRPAAMAALTSLPDADFSFIYETGRREMGEVGFPVTSEWATKYGCGTKVRRVDIVDTKAGYLYDSSRLNTQNPAWGLLPGPGTAEVYEYPKCKDGRIVFDVARLNKGHTEGLEPHVTEYLVKLMVSAKGGKLQQMK